MLHHFEQKLMAQQTRRPPHAAGRLNDSSVYTPPTPAEKPQGGRVWWAVAGKSLVLAMT
jgi:hypothetical protein